MSKHACNLFIKVDKLFTDGNVNTNAFNSSYTKFCPEGGCNNNYDRIGALCDYLLTELPNSDDKPKDSKTNANKHYEYVFMWLASKFLGITHDVSYTLNEYYDDFLVNHKDKFNYWNKLDNIKHLKDSNVTFMTSLYNMLMNICKALVENEISKFDLNKFKKFDYEFYKNYKLVNDEEHKCDPYIQLLTDLKKTYDEYRSLAIKEISKNKDDNYNVLTFSPITNNDNQKDLLFQSHGCKKLHEFFQQFSKRPKPKNPLSEPQPPSNGLQDKKDDGKKDKEPQKDTNQPTKKESQSSTIGEEFNFEKIRDYSLQIFDNYSPLFNHVATRIGHNMRDMVTHNFNDMVGIGAKYLKAIEKVNFPKFQFQVPNNQQKESEKSKKEKVEPPASPQTTGGTTLSSNDIPSKVVDVLGNNLVGLNRNITRLVSSKFEGCKVAIIALEVASITIILAIMYWYLYYGCGKPMKKKKMVNKIINLVDQKRKTQRIISSIDRKRAVKTNIDSDYEEKTTIIIINPYDERNITIQSIKAPSLKITLLNTHKHIYVNPSPFINLFFLLIFFVYKREYISLQ
ncbi:PIR protein CIR protein [Plasmodium vinckei lentum]|uniref:PIR protein CIR protein n=1 Tax=Plasmodium vinckei lentum TaxID=138297 RepID=A0A6V7RZ32_PLAVN|nr:PIR protein CIR protein [Plasmodium vinckei lentum]